MSIRESSERQNRLFEVVIGNQSVSVQISAEIAGEFGDVFPVIGQPPASGLPADRDVARRMIIVPAEVFFQNPTPSGLKSTRLIAVPFRTLLAALAE